MVLKETLLAKWSKHSCFCMTVRRSDIPACLLYSDTGINIFKGFGLETPLCPFRCSWVFEQKVPPRWKDPPKKAQKQSWFCNLVAWTFAWEFESWTAMPHCYYGSFISHNLWCTERTGASVVWYGPSSLLKISAFGDVLFFPPR